MLLTALWQNKKTNMKKTILAAVLGLFCVGASAQYRPTFIIQGGYQGANISNVKNSKIHHGFRVGVAADFEVYEDDAVALSIQPGVNYVTKGVSAKEGKIKATMSLNYVEVPVLVNARFDVADDLNAFVNFGPYFAYGVGGKVSSSGEGVDASVGFNPFKKKKFGDKEFSLANAFDAGLQVGAGLEYSRFLVGVSAQYGLTNVYGKNGVEAMKDNLQDSSKGNSNIGFFATVGYRF